MALSNWRSGRMHCRQLFSNVPPGRRRALMGTETRVPIAGTSMRCINLTATRLKRRRPSQTVAAPETSNEAGEQGIFLHGVFHQRQHRKELDLCREQYTQRRRRSAVAPSRRTSFFCRFAERCRPSCLWRITGRRRMRRCRLCRRGQTVYTAITGRENPRQAQ